MNEIAAMIEEAKAMANRLNSMLDLIQANLAGNEPEFRYFRSGDFIWRMPPTGQGDSRNIDEQWSHSICGLRDCLEDETIKEITAEEGEPS